MVRWDARQTAGPGIVVAHWSVPCLLANVSATANPAVCCVCNVFGHRTFIDKARSHAICRGMPVFGAGPIGILSALVEALFCAFHDLQCKDSQCCITSAALGFRSRWLDSRLAAVAGWTTELPPGTSFHLSTSLWWSYFGCQRFHFAPWRIALHTLNVATQGAFAAMFPDVLAWFICSIKNRGAYELSISLTLTQSSAAPSCQNCCLRASRAQPTRFPN
jgi:hypothetical protein